MNPGFTNSTRKIYRLVAAIWLLLFLAVGALIVRLDIQQAKRLFEQHAALHWQQANDRVHINETILEGFTAMISASNYSDRALVRSYAKKMLLQYPHIFMFEIVEKVAGDRLASFTSYYRRTLYPEFEVKSFSYETDRRWGRGEAAPFYLPIVFMEPFPEESRKVLGLDLCSSGSLRRAVETSAELGHAVSSDPFRLVEGYQAYVLLRPIPLSAKAAATRAAESGAEDEYAVLVIRTDTLLGNAEHVLPGMRELLYNPSFSSTDPAGYLHLHRTQQPGRLASLLFPRLAMSRELDSAGQPFVLDIQQQLGWSIVSWGKLGVALAFAAITFVVMVLFARLYYRNQMERAEMTTRLFYLANHDALTGLANRNLLADRLSHAISQAARSNGRLAVLFLDLDKFKQINDSLGHDVGDSVLRHVAGWLRACVRAEDTIARLGGDEFVLVLENIRKLEDVEQVVSKVKSGFEQPFEVDSRSVTLGVSVGVAIYPADGRDMESLLARADSAMYMDKDSGI